MRSALAKGNPRCKEQSNVEIHFKITLTQLCWRDKQGVLGTKRTLTARLGRGIKGRGVKAGISEKLHPEV